ncbi:cupin domain-containing protein [Ottowia thiooxydans]|uniref:cupin domain-containing protein n=1 Tax=Ottowia thiooxydans TaxID=219182 RepID=UPI000425FB4B|nr:cupin domain-containing protein [Ottowia thiooxydans]
MAQPHLQSGQIGSVLPLGEAMKKTPSYALLKAKQLEVIRLVLLAGKSMPEHQVSGEITVQCLEGEVEFRSGSEVHVMHGGDFLHLDGRAPHSLIAQKNASVLLTICLAPA